MRIEFSVASFEVCGEPSILSYSTCTECKLGCVAVSFGNKRPIFTMVSRISFIQNSFSWVKKINMVICMVRFSLHPKVSENMVKLGWFQHVLYLAKLHCRLFLMPCSHFAAFRLIGSLCCSHYTNLCHLVRSFGGCEAFTLHGSESAGVGRGERNCANAMHWLMFFTANMDVEQKEDPQGYLFATM